jgi:hypothetical protein
MLTERASEGDNMILARRTLRMEEYEKPFSERKRYAFSNGVSCLAVSIAGV